MFSFTFSLSSITIVQYWSLGFQLCDFSPLGITVVRYYPRFELRDFGPSDITYDYVILVPQVFELLLSGLSSLCHFKHQEPTRYTCD